MINIVNTGFMRPRLLLYLFILLVNSHVWADSSTTHSVIFFNGDSHDPVSVFFRGNSEYTIIDTDLNAAICTIGDKGYVKIAVPSERHLLIQYKVSAFGFEPIGSTTTVDITRGMAGTIFEITRSFWNHISILAKAADLSRLIQAPDLTIPLTTAVDAMGPYDRAYFLLSHNSEKKSEISKTAQVLEPNERDSLYQYFKIDPTLAFGNLFPGFGYGSFREGDMLGGTIFALGDIGTGAAVIITGSVALASQDPFLSSRQKAETANSDIQFLTAICVWAGMKILEVSGAIWYAQSHNTHLSNTLGIEP